jgi:RNA polymerase sigma-70 factor (ECF subfamily)
MAEEPPPTAAPEPTSPTDGSLLRRLRAGQSDAATQLYLRYAERLRALTRAKCSPELARRLDFEDIVQSVFGSFFRGVGEGCYYEVAPGEELWGLLLVIALNKIRAKGAFHRAAKRDVRITVGGNRLESCRDPEDEDAFRILKLTVAEVLDSLPPVPRQMAILRIDGYEVAEIARKTRRSKRTVERNLQEFRKRLATLLDPPR